MACQEPALASSLGTLHQPPITSDRHAHRVATQSGQSCIVDSEDRPKTQAPVEKNPYAGESSDLWLLARKTLNTTRPPSVSSPNHSAGNTPNIRHTRHLCTRSNPLRYLNWVSELGEIAQFDEMDASGKGEFYSV